MLSRSFQLPNSVGHVVVLSLRVRSATIWTVIASAKSYADFSLP